MDVSARETGRILFVNLLSNVLNRQFQPYGIQCYTVFFISKVFSSLPHSFPVTHSKMMDLPVRAHDLC